MVEKEYDSIGIRYDKDMHKMKKSSPFTKGILGFGV